MYTAVKLSCEYVETRLYQKINNKRLMLTCLTDPNYYVNCQMDFITVISLSLGHDCYGCYSVMLTVREGVSSIVLCGWIV